MNKFVKIPLTAALALSVVLPTTTSAFASQSNDTVNTEVTNLENKAEFPVLVNGIEIYVPYEKDDVRIEKTQSFSEGVTEEIKIFDNETNNFLESYRVVDVVNPDRTSNISTFAADGNYNQKWVEKTQSYGPASATLRTLLEIYSSGSFREIRSVIDHQWQTNSGVHKIVNKKHNTIATDRKWPTLEIETVGSATIQATVSASITAQYEKAGFTIGGSAGSDIIMRKNFDIGFRYSVY